MSCAPCASHRSKAVSCSLKKEEGLNSAASPLEMRLGSCMRHISAAMSHACGRAWGWVCACVCKGCRVWGWGCGVWGVGHDVWGVG